MRNLTNFMDQLTVTQLVKKLPASYRTPRFITVFTRSRNWSLFWASCIQSTTSHHTSLRPILVSSPQVFRSELCTHLTSLVRATYPAHLILLGLITLITDGEAYNVRNSLQNFPKDDSLNADALCSVPNPHLLLINVRMMRHHVTYRGFLFQEIWLSG
jgi:hypothetical protein